MTTTTNVSEPEDAPTPETDAEAYLAKADPLFRGSREELNEQHFVVTARFARSLERRLSKLAAEKDAEIAAKQKEVDQARTTRRAYQELAMKKHKEDAEAIARCAKLETALRELYAQVKGECPSILNEDSGGDGQLDISIAELLQL